MDTPAPEASPADDSALSPATYARLSGRRRLLAWALMLALIGCYTRAALSERNPFAEGRLFLTLRSDVLLQYGGRPNWSDDVLSFLTCPFIERDVLSLVIVLLWMLGLARGVEGQMGGLGMFAVFFLSALAASVFSSVYGPAAGIDAGAIGGVAGLVGFRLGYGIRWFRRLPRAVAVRCIVQFFFLVGLVTLMHFVIKLYARVDYVPWELLGGVGAGITLGLLLPPIVPAPGELGRAVRLALGMLCLGLACYGQIGLWLRPANQVESLARPQLVDHHIEELGMTFGIGQEAQMTKINDHNWRSDDQRLFVFTRPRSSFDDLTWESTRQIRMHRERMDPGTVTYIGAQIERTLVGDDGFERSCVQTTVGYDRGDVHTYELWFSFMNSSTLVFLIYPIEPQDAYETEWVEDSVRRFRFDEP